MSVSTRMCVCVCVCEKRDMRPYFYFACGSECPGCSASPRSISVTLLAVPCHHPKNDTRI